MMKKCIVCISTLLLSTVVFAYEWDSIGPSDVHVNNFNTVFYNISIEILSTANGIMINEGGNWIEYSFGGLPARGVVGLDPNHILVLLGNGSYSDGVYTFDLTSHEFEVIEWIASPRFLHFCEANSTYYAGGTSGTWKSTDGYGFTPIPYFNGKNCLAFAYYENHLLIPATNRIHYSSDSGQTWTATSSGVPYLPELVFHDSGTAYGIFPDDTYSSGLWRSYDFGETWDPEYYNTYMSSVGTDIAGNLFVGWEYDGIAQLDPVNNETFFFNEGLPDLNINKITVHPDIDAVNIVACTDNGAYMLTEYPLAIDESMADNQSLSLKNYPNPFVETTTIFFSVHKTGSAILSVYNIQGEKLATLFDGIAQIGHEYKVAFKASHLSEGVYICHLQHGAATHEMMKMIVVK